MGEPTGMRLHQGFAGVEPGPVEEGELEREAEPGSPEWGQ